MSKNTDIKKSKFALIKIAGKFIIIICATKCNINTFISRYMRENVVKEKHEIRAMGYLFEDVESVIAAYLGKPSDEDEKQIQELLEIDFSQKSIYVRSYMNALPRWVARL